MCQAPVAPGAMRSPSTKDFTGDHRLATQQQASSTVSAPAELVHQQVEHPTGAQHLQDQRFSAAAVEASWLESAAGCLAGSAQAAAEAATAGSATWRLQSSAADSQGSWGVATAAALKQLPSQWQVAADAAHKQGPACLNSGPTSGDSQPTWSQTSSTRLEAAEPCQVYLAPRQHHAGPASQGAKALQGKPGAQHRQQTEPLSNLLNSTSTTVDLFSTQQSRVFTDPSLDGAPQQAPASQQDEGRCKRACSHIQWKEGLSSVRRADMARDSSSRSLAQHDLREEQAACSSGNASSSRFVRPMEGNFVCCVQISAVPTHASTHAGAVACRMPQCHLEHRQRIAVFCLVTI